MKLKLTLELTPLTGQERMARVGGDFMLAQIRTGLEQAPLNKALKLHGGRHPGSAIAVNMHGPVNLNCFR